MPEQYRDLMANYRQWVIDQDNDESNMSEPIPAKACECPDREGGQQ
jgi:hypothetical protein